MSGFSAGVRFRSSNTRPRKCLILKGWNCQKAKPDRITAGLEGWNQEPVFRPFWAGGQKSTALFLGVIRLAEWAIKWPFKTLERIANAPCSAGPENQKAHVGLLPDTSWLRRSIRTATTRRAAIRTDAKAPARSSPAGAVWAVGRSGGGGAALAGTGAGGQGDEELEELSQVEPGFVGSAELVLGDGPPVGLRGQPPYTI